MNHPIKHTADPFPKHLRNPKLPAEILFPVNLITKRRGKLFWLQFLSFFFVFIRFSH